MNAAEGLTTPLQAFEAVGIMPLWGCAMANVVAITRGDPSRHKGRWESPAEGEARMSCPGCGGVSSLRRLTVDSTGLVSQAVRCPHAACSFNRYVKLVGWQANSGDMRR